MSESREDIKIKHCVFFKEKTSTTTIHCGCSSPEIYRFRAPELEQSIIQGFVPADVCPYDPEALAFLWKEERGIRHQELRCPEFRHEH